MESDGPGCAAGPSQASAGSDRRHRASYGFSGALRFTKRLHAMNMMIETSPRGLPRASVRCIFGS
eukprot:8189733-Pyramimonas_sp.AAC.1